jgi:uracil-DNA glycosylase family 4
MSLRLRLLDEVERQWRSCRRCDLAKYRQRVVTWRGNPDAPLFIIGEGPGADEDEQGLPFVGASGRLLDKLLERASLGPNDVFISNMVGCRPPGNRTPEREELKACAPRLQQLLRIIRPKTLLLLGATAARLAGVTSVLAHRGSKTEVDVLCYDGEVRSWDAVVTWHPAFLIRSGGQSGDRFAESLADIQQAWKLSQFS